MFSFKFKQKNAGWDKELLKQMIAASGKEVAVGFPANAAGVAVPHYDNGASILQVAIYNNFGTDTIPRRAFMEQSAKKMGEWFGRYMQKHGQSVLNGQVPIDTVLQHAGAGAAGIVKEVITDIKEPENKDSTKRRKKSANPLIASGDMRDAATYDVRKRS